MKAEMQIDGPGPPTGAVGVPPFNRVTFPEDFFIQVVWIDGPQGMTGKRRSLWNAGYP